MNNVHLLRGTADEEGSKLIFKLLINANTMAGAYSFSLPLKCELKTWGGSDILLPSQCDRCSDAYFGGVNPAELDCIRSPLANMRACACVFAVGYICRKMNNSPMAFHLDPYIE